MTYSDIEVMHPGHLPGQIRDREVLWECSPNGAQSPEPAAGRGADLLHVPIDLISLCVISSPLDHCSNVLLSWACSSAHAAYICMYSIMFHHVFASQDKLSWRFPSELID